MPVMSAGAESTLAPPQRLQSSDEIPFPVSVPQGDHASDGYAPSLTSRRRSSRVPENLGLPPSLQPPVGPERHPGPSSGLWGEEDDRDQFELQMLRDGVRQLSIGIEGAGPT